MRTIVCHAVRPQASSGLRNNAAGAQLWEKLFTWWLTHMQTVPESPGCDGRCATDQNGDVA